MRGQGPDAPPRQRHPSHAHHRFVLSDRLLEENKALVRRWYAEVLTQRRAEVIDEIVSMDYRGDTDVPLRAGPMGARQEVNALFATFADMRFTIDDVIAEGDKVVVIWTGDLTPISSHTRPPLPGHTVTVAGISIYRVIDGRIVENRSADDLLGVLDQIDPCLL